MGMINNYELLKREKEPHNIVGFQHGSTTKFQRRPEPQNKYYINSLKLIDFLVKNKDSMLIKLTHQNEPI